MPTINRISGLDLVQDARQLAGQHLTNDLQTLRKLIIPRPGYITTTEEKQAVNGGGFLLNGFISRHFNPTTKSQEIVYRGNGVQRVVYNEDNVPVGVIDFRKSQDGSHFDAYVLAPGENEEIMQVLPDGTKQIFQAPGNFFKQFSINNIGFLAGADKSGSPIYKFFGK